MKQHVKTFPVDLYKRGVLVFIGSREQLRSYIEREGIEIEWDDEADEILDKSSAVTFRLKADIIIYAEHVPDEGVIVHEILHATKHLLRIVEVNDEEAEAYLLEYLYDEIMPWFRSVTSGDARSV